MSKRAALMPIPAPAAFAGRTADDRCPAGHLGPVRDEAVRASPESQECTVTSGLRSTPDALGIDATRSPGAIRAVARGRT